MCQHFHNTILPSLGVCVFPQRKARPLRLVDCFVLRAAWIAPSLSLPPSLSLVVSPPPVASVSLTPRGVLFVVSCRFGQAVSAG